MKNIFTLIISSMIGGLLVLIGMLCILPIHNNNTDRVENSSLTAAIDKAPDDFIHAAEIAMPAVVHITAAESQEMAQKRYQKRYRGFDNPFRFFFGEDDFFGNWFEQGPTPQSGKGSGVIIQSNGYIITNHHVIDFADEFEITLANGDKYNGELVGSDPNTDLAVIKINANKLPVLSYGNSDEVRVGEWVLAVGNPFDLTSTVTAGIVSAKGRNNIIRNQNAIEDFIQTDAAVNPGNSGGALVNMQGELIGINSAIATPTGTYAGYSFAVSSSIVKEVVESIIKYGVARGEIGISVADIQDYEEYYELELQVEQGAVVTEVEEESSAHYAGLLPQDIIVGINGQNVERASDVREIVASIEIGESVPIQVDRNGELLMLEVEVSTRVENKK